MPSSSSLQEEMQVLIAKYGAEACLKVLQQYDGEQQKILPPPTAMGWNLARRLVDNLHISKQAAQLESHENIQLAMLNASFDPMLAIDALGVIVTVNTACLTTFQYEKEELIGQNVSIIVGGIHAAKHDAYLQAYRETGRTKLMGTRRELTARRKDGTELPVIVGLQQVENGVVVGYVRDISDEHARRKLMEQNLADATLKAAVLDASFDSMFTITSTGTIITVNRAAVTTFGYSSTEEMVGQNISICVGAEHAAKHDSYLRRYKETGETRLIGTMRELTGRRKDGTEFPVKLGIERVDQKVTDDDDDYCLVGSVRDITEEVERRRLAAIQESQRKLKVAMLDASFDSMFAIDAVGKIITVNRAAVQTFGYTSDQDLLGNNISMIVGGLHAAKHDAYMKRYMDTGETRLIGTRRELMARRKDGTEFPVVVGIEVIEPEDEDGEKLLVGYVHDITEEVERRKLAAQQEAQRKMKAAILDASFDSMFAIDSVGKMLTVNRAAVETFGYKSEAELLGKNVSIIVGGIHAANHDAYMKRYMDTGETRLIGTKRELTARRKDGSEFPVLVGIEVIHPEDGGEKLLVGYVRDITEEMERRRLAAIQEQQRKLKVAMLDASFDSMFAIDAVGKIMTVNRAAVLTFGYTSDQDLLGNNISMIVGGLHAAKHDAYMKRYMDTGETRLIGTRRELMARRKDGTEFPVVVGIEVIEPEDEDGEKLLVGYVHDITEEVERRKLAAQEEAQRKMKAAILDASFDSMFAIDSVGKILTVNRAAVETFGYESEAELLGKNVSIIVGGIHAANHDAYMKRYMDTGETRLIGTKRELTARRKDNSEFPVFVGIEVIHPEDSGEKLLVGYVRDITEEVERRKLAAQQEAQRKMKAAILDASFDSMFAIDSVGTILTVNRAAIITFGYDDESELLDRNISIIVGGIHAVKHDSYMKRYMDTGETRLIGTKRELTARRKDNSEFPVLVGIEVIEQEDESSKLLVGYVRDISEEVERRKLAAQQEAQRKMKAAILDASFDSMFAIDSVGKILTVNRAAIKTFGYESEAELLGRNIAIIVGGIHAAKHDAYMKRYMDTGETRLIGTKRELKARRKDDSEFPVLVGIEVIEQEDKSKLLVGYVRDISEEVERRKLAAEQEAQRKLKAAILDASFDSMFAIDSVGKILTVNRAAVETFGYNTEDELLGQNISIIVGGIHAAKHDAYMKRYMDTAEVRLIGTRRELTARRKCGTEFPVVVGISVVKQGEGRPPLLVGYVRDITEEKRAMQLSIEKRAAEELLLNMLPREIALRLIDNPNHLADHHANATILFADIVGFTKLSSRLEPLQVVHVLNDLFTRFDKLVDLYNLNKVKTIGDCFMVTSVPTGSAARQGCMNVCHFAFDMVQALLAYNEEHTDEPLNLRVGINTGPVVAGVVGQKRFLYDLWGDAVNVASRMESTGVPGLIQVTKSVVDTVGPRSFIFEHRGSIDVKGKGKMDTFFLKTRIAAPGTGLHHYESNRTLDSSSGTMDDFLLTKLESPPS